MQTLKEQIVEAEKELYLKKCAVAAHEKYVQALHMERHHCKHEFSAPIKGYEHEGGMCVVCGINEVYAQSSKIGIG